MLARYSVISPRIDMHFTFQGSPAAKPRIKLRFSPVRSITADKGAARPHNVYWVGNVAADGGAAPNLTSRI
jgi:hypothetical protein